LFFLWDGITNLFYYKHVGNTGIYSHCIVSCLVYSVSSFFILAHWNLNGKVWRNWKTGFFSFNAAYYISEIIYTRHPHMQMLFFVCMKQTFCWHIEIGTAECGNVERQEFVYLALNIFARSFTPDLLIIMQMLL